MDRVEKRRKIQALAERGATPGERAAAQAALDRMSPPVPTQGQGDIRTAFQRPMPHAHTIRIQDGHVYVDQQRHAADTNINSIQDLFQQVFRTTNPTTKQAS